MLKWDTLEEKIGGAVVKRSKVPGGWLVVYSNGRGTGFTFYPDPNHKWDGSSLD
ncbi:MAG: hypothetical protein KQI78_12180 [Deltaproteobacteria bacterium]|nr:hypothetical protein [Deltaproteobacteria bacterium]